MLGEQGKGEELVANIFCVFLAGRDLAEAIGGDQQLHLRQYLQHDYYTDIITFDYDEDDVISGDLFISLDTVRTNAEQVGATYEEELHRVIIHGILHLCGINDKGPGEREIMEENENKALAMLKE